MKTEFKFISIDKLEPNPFEIREKEEKDEEAFKELIQSVKVHGLLQPIIVREKKGGYQVIAGGRRFRAYKAARLDKVEAIVRDADDKEVRKWALIENAHRKDLSDVEKSNALKNIYIAYDYTIDTAIGNLDNLRHYRQGHSSKLQAPKEFVELCDDIGYGPDRQYRILRLARDLSPRMFEYVEKMELDTQKKLMLTRPTIKENPELQKTVAKMIRHVPVREAREIVHNIETGTYKFTGKGFKVKGKSEKIVTPQEFTEEAYMTFLRTSNVTRDLLYLLTGLEKRSYTEEDVEKTGDHRLEKVKQLKDHDLNIFWNNLSPLKNAVDNMMDKIEEELDTRGKHKELLRR